jgi:hypothetical protein
MDLTALQQQLAALTAAQKLGLRQVVTAGEQDGKIGGGIHATTSRTSFAWTCHGCNPASVPASIATYFSVAASRSASGRSSHARTPWQATVFAHTDLVEMPWTVATFA